MQFKQRCCATRHASAMHPYHVVCHYAKSVELEKYIFAKVLPFFIHDILGLCTSPKHSFDAAITCRVGREQLTGFIFGLNPRVHEPVQHPARQIRDVSRTAFPSFSTRVCQIERCKKNVANTNLFVLFRTFHATLYCFEKCLTKNETGSRLHYRFTESQNFL